MIWVLRYHYLSFQLVLNEGIVDILENIHFLTASDSTISEAEKDFTIVKKVFLEKFANNEKPRDVLWEATDSVLDQEDNFYSRIPKNQLQLRGWLYH